MGKLHRHCMASRTFSPERNRVLFTADREREVGRLVEIQRERESKERERERREREEENICSFFLVCRRAASLC